MRTEEEKNRDIIIHEKRSLADDYIAAFGRKRRRAMLISAAFAAFGAVGTFALMLAAYDKEQLIDMILIFICYILLFIAVYYISGAIFMKSLPEFLKWASMRSRWKELKYRFNDLDEKFYAGEAYEKDIRKTESELLNFADRIVSEGESSESINI